MFRARNYTFRLLLAAASLFCAAIVGVTGAAAQDANHWSFVSVPNLHPSRADIFTPPLYKRLQPGYFLLTDGGPLMLDNHLQPVWFLQGLVTEDLKQQTFEGRPVLTWWQGSVTPSGLGIAGTLYVVNEHYQVVAKLSTSHGWGLDEHEAVIQGHDVWVTAYRYLKNVKFPGTHGRRGILLDDAIQEYDLRNGRLLRTWTAFHPGRTPHVPLSESYIDPPPANEPNAIWDAYHINSIQLIGSHELLVSVRNTSAVYLVDIRNGKVIWTLGGKRSTFRIPRIARFSLQHEVTLHPGGIVTMFDDRCCEFAAPLKFINNGASRGLVLKLNFKTRRVSLVHQYPHQPPLHTAALGSMQELANGNVLVGWGTAWNFTEYSPSGKSLLDAKLDDDDQSYRTLFTSNWVGTPYYPPSVSVTASGDTKTVYASWNGATEVASWEVLAGKSPKHLKVIARHPRTGFETAVPIPDESFAILRVEAVDGDGHPLGSRSLTNS